MKKIIYILRNPDFWIRFIGVSLLVTVFELFLLGYWALPYINYRISFMGEVMTIDLVFVGVFAVIFGFGTALFLIAKKFNAATCAIGSGSGLVGFFTLLCPICPIFFLTYFGLSATVMMVAPYFWLFRLVSLALLLIGITLLWRRIQVQKSPKFDVHSVLQKASIVALFILFFANQALAYNVGHKMLGGNGMAMDLKLSGDIAKDVSALVTPSTLPFYGPELGLDFSSISAINKSIKRMSVMAPKQGSNPIQLTAAEMERYVTIGTEPLVTCEFCCGVKTLVRKDGTPTCGCAHSIAMRGMTAYLLQSYPDMTNAEISYEIIRQKGLYFPKQMQKRMASQLAGDVADFTPDIKYLVQNLTAEELADLQNKAKDSGFEPDTTNLDMVGGC